MQKRYRFSLNVLLVLFFLSISFITGFIVGNIVYSRSYAAITRCSSLIQADKIWTLVQKWRETQNLQPYTNNQRTCEIANTRVQDIQSVFSHDLFRSRYDNTTSTILGENLSEGFFSEQEVLSAWINSPAHKINLLYSFPYSCIRCLNNRCVQIFADR